MAEPNKIPMNFDVLQVMQTILGNGGKAPIVINLTSSDWTPPEGFVVAKLTCTGGEKIVIDWSDGVDTVENLVIPATQIIPIFNVAKIKKTGTDATDIVAWPLVY